MHVGIVQIGEPLETDPGIGRPFRAGMLARALVAQGHRVTWWTSNFNHTTKSFRFPDTHVVVQESSGVQLRFLYGRAYARNISRRRVRHHQDMANALARDLDAVDPVDIFVVGIPIHELAAVVRRKRPASPVVLDVRDPWPDLYLSVLPRWLRPIGRVALRRSFALARGNLRTAAAVTAVSEGFLRWAVGLAGRPATPGDRVFPIGFPAAHSARRSPDPSGPLRLGFIGAFSASFDLETVIAAVTQVHRRSPGRVHFAIAGDGDQRERLAAMIAADDPVTFVGWLDQDAAGAFVGQVEVGVLPYGSAMTAAMPNKLFEYLAWGLPLLSSLQGEARELLTDNDLGEQYVAGNIESAVAAIDALLTRRDALVLQGERARAVFERDFSEDRIYPAMALHLQDVLFGHRDTVAGRYREP